MRGRRPTPTKLRLLTGNPQKRRINEREPQPIGAATKPEFVAGAAAHEWDRVIRSMPPGFFTAADVPPLVVFVMALSVFRAALARIGREGTMALGSLGQEVPHPMLAIVARQSETILRAGDRLGLSPLARTRLAIPEIGGGKFAGLLGRDGPDAA